MSHWWSRHHRLPRLGVVVLRMQEEGRSETLVEWLAIRKVAH
ncbi:hypothetical protein MMON44395_19385 [Mycolicibacterium monacense DSM 44395]|nr:hypothetical protein [Mycolicibacterium monacense DSM 44395]